MFLFMVKYIMCSVKMLRIHNSVCSEDNRLIVSNIQTHNHIFYVLIESRLKLEKWINW